MTPVTDRTMCLTSSSDGWLCLIKRDDYNILQHDHIVLNRSSSERMIYSALKTLASHGSNCSSVRLMGHATNEHLARFDMREPEHPKWFGTLYTLSGSRLRMSS
jgi:hypothetical protein